MENVVNESPFPICSFSNMYADTRTVMDRKTMEMTSMYWTAHAGDAKTVEIVCFLI